MIGALALMLAAAVSPQTPAPVATPVSPEAKAALECAGWAAIGSTKNDDSSYGTEGFGLVTIYFIGRAEGAQPGLDVEAAFSPELIAAVRGNIDVVAARCAADATRLSETMAAVGSATEN